MTPPLLTYKWNLWRETSSQLKLKPNQERATLHTNVSRSINLPKSTCSTLNCTLSQKGVSRLNRVKREKPFTKFWSQAVLMTLKTADQIPKLLNLPTPFSTLRTRQLNMIQAHLNSCLVCENQALRSKLLKIWVVMIAGLSNKNTSEVSSRDWNFKRRLTG